MKAYARAGRIVTLLAGDADLLPATRPLPAAAPGIGSRYGTSRFALVMTSAPGPLGRWLSRLLRHSRLSDEEQNALLSLRTRVFQARARTDIVRPGEVVDHACLIARGLAGRFDQMRDGRRQITALHIPGDMCDLHSVVQPRASWSITALSQTSVVHVPHSDLLQLVNNYPAIAMAFWRDTALDSAVLARWMGNLGRKDAQSRAAHLFCEMGVRMELAQAGARTSYSLPLTQEQLADAMGLTAVHVNRTLQRLRETGAISLRSGQVEILDWERLARDGQFEPDYLFPAPNKAEAQFIQHGVQTVQAAAQS